jgi:hypothetical protein
MIYEVRQPFLKCGTIAPNDAAAGEKGKNDGMVPGMGP